MNNELNSSQKFEDNSFELFSKLHIPWKMTKDEIWKDLSARIKDIPIIKMQAKIVNRQMALAASIVVLLGFGVFMRTYTSTKFALSAQSINVKLPYGSAIALNAQSKISYHPLWWWANRHVELSGEAFFDVKKGASFKVETTNGNIEVLGTSFNVFSRENRYEVTCVTGKVKVDNANASSSVIIYPEQKAVLQKTGQFQIDDHFDVNNAKAWMYNKLVFTSLPLKEVFSEIKRQYNIDIIFSDTISYQYTGSFEKTKNVTEILELICRPFELNVLKRNENLYKISK